MATKLITVTIDLETTESTVDLTGFHGKGCAEVMKAFDGLGKVSKDDKKPEFKQETCNIVRK
jgi:hypothetical protein